MLGSNTLGTTVGSPEHNGHIHFSSRHVECLCSRVDHLERFCSIHHMNKNISLLQGPAHLVNSLHGEVEGHELKDWPQVVEGSSDCKPREAHLSDWGV